MRHPCQGDGLVDGLQGQQQTVPPEVHITCQLVSAKPVGRMLPQALHELHGFTQGVLRRRQLLTVWIWVLFPAAKLAMVRRA